jgi:hypothetical protein
MSFGKSKIFVTRSAGFIGSNLADLMRSALIAAWKARQKRLLYSPVPSKSAVYREYREFLKSVSIAY